MKVDDKQYGDILYQWLLVPVQDHGHLFVRHFHKLNPNRNRYMLMQVVLSDFKRGHIWEGVYESRTRNTHWVESVTVDGITYPKLCFNNGGFEVLQWNIDGQMTYLSAMDLGREKFLSLLASEEFAPEDEVQRIVTEGIQAQPSWIHAIL